jgi:predicted ferric reductase
VLPDLRADEKARAVLLGGIVLAHVTLWTLSVTLWPTLVPVRQLVAEGFSSLAIVSLSTNLLLATRMRPLERWLRGLDRLFVTHRTIGLTVAVLVTTHFLLVPKSVGYVASKPWGYTTISLVLLVIFIASAPRFPWSRLVPMRYETWKSTHRLNGLLVALAVTHSLFAHTYVKQSPLLVPYVYGVATLGLLAWLYKEFAFRRFGPFRSCSVASSQPLGSKVLEVVLASPPPALARTAGQFAFVSFEDGPSREQHPFTINSGSGSDLRFSIKASGDFTEQLQSGVPEGSEVTIEGPYGAFDYRRGGPRQLWIAGGIGITPFLSMAEDLDPETSVVLIWSVRDEQEAVYAPALVKMAAEKPNLDFRLHPTAQKGHLDPAALELGAPLGSYSIYICGPVAMRKALIRQLTSLGVARSQVFFEEFRLR